MNFYRIQRINLDTTNVITFNKTIDHLIDKLDQASNIHSELIF